MVASKFKQCWQQIRLLLRLNVWDKKVDVRERVH